MTAANPNPETRPIVPADSLTFQFTPDPATDDLDLLNGLTSGHLVIAAGDYILTRFTVPPESHAGARISANALAEWLAINWHRLRWEARPDYGKPNFNGAMAHQMINVGQGYDWPRLTIHASPNRQQVILTSKPTADPACNLRYHGLSQDIAVPGATWEQAVDQFISQTIQILEKAGQTETDLHDIWETVNLERNIPELHRYRIAEAILGNEPADGNPEAILAYLAERPEL